MDYRLVFPEDLSPSITRNQWVPFGLLFIASYVAAYIGSYLQLTNQTFPGVIWPMAGVAMAGLVLGGRKLWPAITLATFLASIAIGTPILSAAFMSVAHTLKAIAGAWMLDWLGFNVLLARAKDAIALLLTAMIPTTIVPTFAAINRIYLRDTLEWNGFWDVWGPLWIGQIVSVIVLVPIIVRWFSRYHFRRNFSEALEIAGALTLLVAINILLYWTPYRDFYAVPLAYFILVPFIWIALRVGPRFMTVAVFVNAAFAIAGAANGISGQFSGTLGDRLFQAEIQTALISFIFLVLAGIAEERKDIAKALHKQVGKLQRANQRIREAGKAKNQFIAILAHELRNPLAPIVSSLELIRMEDDIGEKSKRWVDTIESHAGSMRRLLDDFLDVARITERKFRLERESIDLREVVGLSLSAATPMIESKNHLLSYEAPHAPVMVDADPVRIEQAVVNLLNNAARYTEAGGAITVSLSTEGEMAVVSVRDTGIGISPEMQARIFEPFVQAKTGKAGNQGLGIGLSLTKELIGMHGGSIEGRSPGPGLGSEFIIRLPLLRTMDDTMLTQPTMTLPSALPTSTASRRILIVDDNEAAAEGLGKLLEYRGHKVRLAHTAENALKQVRAEAPEVVVLDIGLPDQDGYEVARQLRGELAYKGFLIALTGYGQYEDREQAKEAGFDQHLTKPVGLREMEQVLSRLP